MHNPKAGAGIPTKKQLIRKFERAGFKVDYHSTQKKGVRQALENAGDMVVIAGGDGTVRKIARRLIGHEVPIAILPLGTANNIAKGLGLERTLGELIPFLARSHPIKFDVGIARGPWGEVPFFEAAGAGLFPSMMAEHESNLRDGVRDAVDAHGSLRGGAHLLQQVLHNLRAADCNLRLDGKEFSGRYLLIEAMNIPSIGPGLKLAPKARTGDGLLDAVLVTEDQREELDRHLARHLKNKGPAPFKVHRVRKMQLACSPTEFHFDDECWPGVPRKKPRGKNPHLREIHVEIDVRFGALRLLVPS